MKKALLLICALSAGLSYAQTSKIEDVASKLDYTNPAINATAAQEALSELEVKLGTCYTGIYNMRGGKDTEPPAAHAYQYQYSLNTDNYAQYFVVTHKDFPYANATLTSTYSIGGFVGAAHGGYDLAKNAFPSFLTEEKANLIPEIKAVYLLYYDLIAQENADLSGPFTYLEHKNYSTDPRVYQSVKDIYYTIKADIDNCVACWNYYDDNRSEEYKALINDQLFYDQADGIALYNTDKYDQPGKRFDNYIRLANSLKLRMAMHMAKVDPDVAKAWAEEAVAGGVIEDWTSQMGVHPSVTSTSHPLVMIACTWNDTRISASMESLLMSLDHPYTKYLFKKNSNDIVNLGEVSSTESLKGDVTPADTRIMGIRAGSLVGDGQAATNPFTAYSTLDPVLFSNAAIYFISLSEVCFLRAEGAIRGWDMGGTAQEFYEKGIRYAYFEDPLAMECDPSHWAHIKSDNYLNYLEDYMAVEEAKPYVQVEPQGLGANWSSQTKIGVKWNEADDKEIKLEKIITQKYLALFPNSHEAWTELRRTGYPKMFPVLNPDQGDGSLKLGDVIRRIPYMISDPVQLGYWEATGLPALGGPDLQATRLWWDVDCGNFEGGSGIAPIQANKVSTGKTYTIDGRACNEQVRGIMIRDGKKFVNR